MNTTKNTANTPNFILHFAIKDGLRQKVSLSILASCCIIATAALLAILSLKENISTTIEDNSKSLLGSDFTIASRQAPNEETEQFLNSLESRLQTKLLRSEEISFASMAHFEETQATIDEHTQRKSQSRLIQISAVQEPYPLYGELEIEPSHIGLPEKGKKHVLVDYSLKNQFNLSKGQTIILGKTKFTISGFIVQLPGNTETRATLAPRVLIHQEDLKSTELIRKGSIVRYKYLYKVLTPISQEKIKAALEEQTHQLNLSMETYEERAESLKKNINVVYHFFDSSTILGFLLGGIGVWSGAVVYFRKKSRTLETLHFLGLSKKEIMLVLIIQIFFFGFIGTLSGCLLGIGVQYLLPKIVSTITPVEIPFALSWGSILMTILSSTVILLSSSLLAFSSSGSILAKKKQNSDKHSSAYSQRIKALVPLLILFLSILFLWLFFLTKSFTYALIYGGAACSIFGILITLSYLLRDTARKLSNKIQNFQIAQGIKNLYRPFNQTVLLLLAIGVISFTSLFIDFTRHSSVQKLKLLDQEDSPNLLLFDIQDDQIEDLKKLIQNHELPLIEQVPVITMRMTHVKGIAVQDLRTSKTKDSSTSSSKNSNKSKKIPDWVLTREYRSSYKAKLEKHEEITSGEYIGTWETNEENSIIPVSIEKGLLEKLDLKLGDKIRFSIQGVPIETYISSVRDVDWQQFRPNFFFLFPDKALSGAPQNTILLSRYDTQEQNAKFQNKLVHTFGNISAIDLQLVLATANTISTQLKNVVMFLSLIIILSALVILTGIIWASRVSRTEENILLRTLGADGKTLVNILISEYLTLGILGTISGTFLALIFSFLFSTYVLKTPFSIPLETLGIYLTTIIILVVFLGALGAIGTLRRGAIESYRMIES